MPKASIRLHLHAQYHEQLNRFVDAHFSEIIQSTRGEAHPIDALPKMYDKWIKPDVAAASSKKTLNRKKRWERSEDIKEVKRILKQELINMFEYTHASTDVCLGEGSMRTDKMLLENFGSVSVKGSGGILNDQAWLLVKNDVFIWATMVSRYLNHDRDDTIHLVCERSLVDAAAYSKVDAVKFSEMLISDTALWIEGSPDPRVTLRELLMLRAANCTASIVRGASGDVLSYSFGSPDKMTFEALHAAVETSLKKGREENIRAVREYLDGAIGISYPSSPTSIARLDSPTASSYYATATPVLAALSPAPVGAAAVMKPRVA